MADRKLLTAVAFAVVGIYSASELYDWTSVEVTRVTRPGYVIISESGERRNDLFEASKSEVIRVGRWIVRGGKAPVSCGQTTEWYSRFIQMFRSASVEAASCSPGSCGGTWASSLQILTCPSSCDGSFTRYVEDPASGPGQWRYDGSGACPAVDKSGTCRCKQVACT